MKRVLVCDDDRDILDIIDYILTDAGWQVEKSENVNDIIDKIESWNPSVILMDNWIPDMGGIAATQLIKDHPLHKDIPVVYITANSNISSLASQAGADLYLAKPFDLSALEDIVSSAYALKINRHPVGERHYSDFEI
ncbi:MAG TPA: response regulator [Sphingobacteriaceae bacterium]